MGRSSYYRPKRVRVPQEGWVYVFSNPSLRGIRKIGRTSGDLQTRAAELHGTGLPTPFRIELAVWVSDCSGLEQWLHRHLAVDRVTRGREFFRTNLSGIVDAFGRGLSALALQCERDYDPNGLLPGTKERWAFEAAARREAERKAKAEAEELERRARIERELKEAISLAKGPGEEIRLRAAVATGAILLAMAIATVIWFFKAGAGGWTLALVAALWWAFPKVWMPATEIAEATFWNVRAIKRREEIAIRELNEAAQRAISTGAASLEADKSRPEPPRRATLPCTGCGVGLRLPEGRKALARCPKCGKRDYYDTRP